MNTILPVPLLGVNIHPITSGELLDQVSAFISDGGQRNIGYVNVHCMNLAQKDREYQKILNSSDIIYCDGFGVLWASAFLGRSLPERMTGADWLYGLAFHCQEMGHSLYFLGGEPDVAETASLKLRSKFPDLHILGTHHGFFDKKNCDELIKEINMLNPDILLIGFGSPLQERWLWNHRSLIKAPVCWVVGAVFNYISNKVSRGPKWMTDNGMEWLCRLYFEPGRLWRRYLLGNPRFLYYTLREKLRT